MTLTSLNAITGCDPAGGLLERFMDTMARNYNEDLAFAQLFSAWKIPRTVYPLAHDLRSKSKPNASWPRSIGNLNGRNWKMPWKYSLSPPGSWTRSPSSSLALYGRVTDFYLTEAKRATFSYLLNYLPPVLARRELPRATSEPRPQPLGYLRREIVNARLRRSARAPARRPLRTPRSMLRMGASVPRKRFGARLDIRIDIEYH